MNWFLLALIPPALWSVTNHLDKYLLSKFFKGGGVGALMVFSSLIGLLLMPFIVIFHPNVVHISPLTASLIALNGFFYVLATLPYFYALQKDDTSVAVPIFQLIPVFTYVIAYFVLGERLSHFQLFGGMLITLSAIGISFEIKPGKKMRMKWDVLLLMCLSSLFYSINFIFFKFFALESDFWTTSFWEYTGFAVFAFILMIFVRSYRLEFLGVVRKNSGSVLGLNGLNEIINIVAKVSFNYASLLTPIALTWVVDGFQPAFVFIYGLILTLLFPHIAKENISAHTVFQKVTAILIMMIGSYFLNL